MCTTIVTPTQVTHRDHVDTPQRVAALGYMLTVTVGLLPFDTNHLSRG